MSNASYVQYIRFSFTVNVIPEHNMGGKNSSSVQLQYASLPKRDSRNHARPRTYGRAGFVTHAYDMFKAEIHQILLKTQYLTRTLCFPIMKYKLFMYFTEIIAIYSKNNIKPTGLNDFFTNIQEDGRPILTYLLHGAESFLRS